MFSFFTSQKSLKFNKNIQFFRLNTASIFTSSAFTNLLFFYFKRSKAAVVLSQIINEIINSKKLRFEKIVSFILEETLSINTTSNVSQKTLKKFLLSNILKLFIAFKSDVDEEIL